MSTGGCSLGEILIKDTNNEQLKGCNQVKVFEHDSIKYHIVLPLPGARNVGNDCSRINNRHSQDPIQNGSYLLQWTVKKTYLPQWGGDWHKKTFYGRKRKARTKILEVSYVMPYYSQ